MLESSQYQRNIIPTFTEVLEFGHSIGVRGITFTPGYDQWWHALHEIGHFAVKPDGYIALWRKYGGLGVPYMNWFISIPERDSDSYALATTDNIARLARRNGLHPSENCYSGNGVVKPEDPTPDEWGVRAWCLSVLELKGWVSPLNGGKWPASNNWEGRRRNNPYLWMRNQVTSPYHPLYKNGFEQLEAVGIDFSRGILRPTKELVTVGWQPVLGWQPHQSA